MARFEPFPGIRYAHGVDLDSVVAPPYDVIGPVERAELVHRSPHNSVLIELPADDPASGRDRFQVAADLWRQWQGEGVLRADPQTGLYVTRMTFTDEGGTSRSTTGVFGALELMTPGHGDVLPHERTTPKPKGERLSLQRACRANLSPVWGLSMAAGLTERLAPGGQPDGILLGRAIDDDGVLHELWALPASRVPQVSELVAGAPVVLADGHHRYETALAYRAEVRARSGLAPGPHDLILAMIVELSETELTVRAIHRLVSSPNGEAPMLEALARHFDLQRAGTLEGVDARFLSRMDEAGALGLLGRAGVWLARPLAATEAAAEHPLDSARLAVALDGLAGVEVEYQHGVSNVAAAVARGEAQLGILLRPADVATIEALARARQLMPPKTTFFYPKPRTGLVFRSLA